MAGQLEAGTPRPDAAVAAVVRRHTRIASLPWWRLVVLWWACTAFAAMPIVGVVLTCAGNDHPGAPLFRWSAAAGVAIVIAMFGVATRRLRSRVAALARHGELVAAYVAYAEPVVRLPSVRDVRIVVEADPHRQYRLPDRGGRALRPPAWATVGRAARVVVSDHESYGILQVDGGPELLVERTDVRLGIFARPRPLVPLPRAQLRKPER
ncbi:MAG TPA: hypothetical protein VFP84_09720 [Kofleriaceae bacterium]|nr:hypothetical protein [Kofleriaceae bacterium]